MHAFWYTAELVEFVLDDLSKASLARLAMTSRALHGPASARIWKNIELSELLHLLDIVVHPFALPLQISHASEYRRISRTWSRFEMYANFVQSLSLHGLRDDEMDQLESKLLKVLAVRPGWGSGYLFPALRDYSEFFYRSPERDWALLYFSSPSLKEVVLDCGDDPTEQSLVCLLDKLRIQCKDMTVFKLNGVSHTRPLYLTALKELLSSNVKLTAVKGNLWVLVPEVLTILASLSSLAELHVGVGHSLCNRYCIDKSAVSACLAALNFGSLRTLCTYWVDIEVTSALLHNLHTKIETLELSICIDSQYRTTKCWARLAGAIQRCSECLNYLAIELKEWGDDVVGEVISWKLFAPLLLCRAIKEFHFYSETNDALGLRDWDVAAIAAAWPQLQGLTLHGVTRESRVSDFDGNTLSLEALRFLSEQCPELQHLTLRLLDATAVFPMPPDQPRTQRIVLELDSFEIGDPIHVATFINRLWPNAEIFGAETEGPEAEVTLLLQGFQYMKNVQAALAA